MLLRCPFLTGTSDAHTQEHQEHQEHQEQTIRYTPQLLHGGALSSHQTAASTPNTALTRDDISALM